MLTFSTRKMFMAILQDPKLWYLLLNLCICAAAWPHALVREDGCPSSEWSVMCRPCCEYQLIQCRCPTKGSRVGYTVPCCRNALDQCDPCIIHPGCSLFENCKTCHNGTWKANDNFFVTGKYCTECRQGWSGGDCKTCGGVIQRAQGHIALESYPINARCEWTVQVERGRSIELRFSLFSLESDHSCRYDYVEVRDGDDLSSPVIGRFCGDQLPPQIKSSGNVLHILLTSDGYNNFDGFVLTFHEISAIKNPVCTPPEKPVNGYALPVYSPEEELVAVNYWCDPPFILTSSQQRTCFPNGTWSGTIPTCVRACQEPKVSQLVQQSIVKPHQLSRYNMHNLLSAGFIPFKLDRQSNVEREDTTVEELPHGFHPVYTTIEYKCASPLYRHKGSSQRTCLKTGRWSGRHVSCSPVCGKFNTFSTHNLSDFQWPWHAAIYIRSPPATAGAHRPHIMSVSDQQGPTEESTFWHLACSGALLTQRSVLVTAQCVVDKDKQQPLYPAHVKVVMEYQTSKYRMKSLHHLRVSDIIVHPNFYFAPDSNVAVLKLKDKAKISDRVLPVCLPRTQGEEVTVQQAFTSRWILTDNHRHLSRYTPLSQTQLVELSDVARCEKEFALGRAYTTMISDNTLCVIRKPSSHQSTCPSVIPGITTLPSVFSSTTVVLSGHEETQGASGVEWQLLALESFSYEEKNCHQQTSAVQTRISSFRDWIEKSMK